MAQVASGIESGPNVVAEGVLELILRGDAAVHELVAVLVGADHQMPLVIEADRFGVPPAALSLSFRPEPPTSRLSSIFPSNSSFQTIFQVFPSGVGGRPVVGLDSCPRSDDVQTKSNKAAITMRFIFFPPSTSPVLVGRFARAIHHSLQCPRPPRKCRHDFASVVYVADQETPAFQRDRLNVDVVCAGDSITGWNNFGPANSWPYRTYPEFLQELCEPLGLRIANGGIAGEISENGIGQVRDYLSLFPNARYFVVGYGTNDLGMWPDVEATSKRIIENLGRMVAAIRNQGKEPILFNVPYANESMFPEDIAQELHRHRDYHNEHLRRSANSSKSRWPTSAPTLGTSISPTSCTRTARVPSSSQSRSTECCSIFFDQIRSLSCVIDSPFSWRSL